MHEGQVALGQPRFSRQSELRHGQQHFFARGAEMRRYEEFGAECFLRFVDGEAGHVAGQFVERPTGFADVERIEVFAVMRIDRARAIPLQVLVHPFHGGSVGRTEGDVIDRSGSGRRRPEAACIAHVDGVAGGGGEPTDRVGCASFRIAEVGRQEANGFLRLFREDRGATQAADGVFRRDIARAPGGRTRNRLGADELDDDTVRILEPQHRLTELLRWP